jgi:hypothetical protein
LASSQGESHRAYGVGPAPNAYASAFGRALGGLDRPTAASPNTVTAAGPLAQSGTVGSRLFAAGEGGVEAGDSEADAEAGATCSVALPSYVAVAGGGTCLESLGYAFDGTWSDCAGNYDGGVPLSVCNTLCPPPSGEFGQFAGYPLGDCRIETGCSLPGCTTKGELVCQYSFPSCNGIGRRPRGLRSLQERRALSPPGRYLVRMAYLEAASVVAFERLAHELETHGAPPSLRRSALRAARDEVRHARIATRLARCAGGSVREPVVRKSRKRSLVAMAVENAVEGCVHETFGAALAMAQSMAAPDPRLRTAMRQIARDEMRHAELAWSVAEWLEGRLTEPAPVLVDELGLPPPRVAHGIALDLAAALWLRGRT